MQITENKVVTIDYTLKDDDDQIIDQASDGSFAYLHGAKNIIPGLENALKDKQAGDTVTVSIAPEEGYGLRDDSKSQVVPMDMFEEKEMVQVGAQFHAQDESGHTIMITIVAVEGDNVTIDGNHPLAGVQLNFDVKVVEVRDATPEELDHGHVHGPGGHNH